MANADIIIVGLSEAGVIIDLYNEVFRPVRDRAYIERRIRGRVSSLMLLAQIDGRPVGFAIGYELKPGTFYCWYLGVLPDFRRAGIASQLMEAMTARATSSGYHTLRFECFNSQRAMLHLGISQGYDIVGMRLHRHTQENLLILEQTLAEQADED